MPELKIPVAKARSRLGNHSATALMEPGKFPASPIPSKPHATAKEATPRAKACPMAASDHQVMASAKPIARAQPVDDPPEPQHHDAVGKLEGEDDPTVVALRHAEDLLHMMGEDGDGAAINVVDDGAKEQNSANQPTQVRYPERARWRRGSEILRV